MTHHSVTLLLITISVLSGGQCEQKCTKSLNAYENYLATKTPYRIVANYNSTEIKYPGCAPTKLWAVVRHGTRNPSVSLIDKMRTRLTEIRDLILENLAEATDDINNFNLDMFRAWSVKVQPKDEKKLTHEGEDEMLLLAERLQNRFPSVLSKVYSESWYNFKFTATQRTKKSARAFAAGLFGRNTVKDVYFPEPLQKDPVLRFYKLCNKWRQEVKKNPETLKEVRQFHSGPTITKVIEDVNKRLGFDDELTLPDVHAMYMTCAYETAWNKRRRSPWCSVFTLDDFKAWAYGEDLKYYWIDGYGYELTYKQACRAVNDMTEFFHSTSEYPKATVYFTHSGTMLKMLAHMEMYKEVGPLLAKDFDNSTDRNWKVSYIDPFGANLEFVLFNCDGRSKVLTMHQERVVRLPSCPDEDLCDFDTFVEYYHGSSQCPFDQMCENEA